MYAIRSYYAHIIVFVASYFGVAAAMTLPELTSRVENMGRVEREALLVKGAKEEGEVMSYNFV